MTPSRRQSPRIWNTDWLVLRGLSRLLHDQVQAYLQPGARMVDLGCGSMPYRLMMRQLGIYYQGADIDGAPDLPIDEQGRVPLPSGSAHAILSVQVFEHVRDLDAYCGEIRRLMHPSGTLFLSTHGTWLYHPHPEDHRRWTRTGLVSELGTRSLAVQEIMPIVGPLATTTLIRLTGYAFVARKLPIVGNALAALLAVTMNLRAAIEDRLTPESMRRDNACVYLVRAVAQ